MYGVIWGHKNIYNHLRIVKEASSNIWNKDLLEGKNPFLAMRKDEFLTSTCVKRSSEQPLIYGAGEDLEAGDMVTIDENGKVWKYCDHDNYRCKCVVENYNSPKISNIYTTMKFTIWVRFTDGVQGHVDVGDWQGEAYHYGAIANYEQFSKINCYTRHWIYVACVWCNISASAIELYRYSKKELAMIISQNFIRNSIAFLLSIIAIATWAFYLVSPTLDLSLMLDVSAYFKVLMIAGLATATVVLWRRKNRVVKASNDFWFFAGTGMLIAILWNHISFMWGHPSQPANLTLVAGLWAFNYITVPICMFHAAGYLLDNEKEYQADV